MTVAASCPDRASLERLLEQGAAPGEVERLAAHLETCARCGETVEALLAADPTAAALRGAKVEAEGSSVVVLRARLAGLRPAANPQDTTPPADPQATTGTPPPLPPPALETTQEKSLSLAPPQQPDEIGRLGGYRILAELGRGGMGVVYKAEDPKLKRLVAVKAMLPGVAADAASRQRFLREAQAMAAVRHDHVVTVFQVDEADGVPFLAMEFLEGMPLDRWLKDGRKPTMAQVLRLGREIAEGLAAAHDRGLIHRDVKPGNIWLDSAHKGRVKILDFGLARAGREDVHLTKSGAIVGTPAYMAPEQARGEKVDPRCDLFSLGCVLYRLCTGALPFSGDTTMALLMALALDAPKPVRALNPDAPAALSELVMRLLEKDPAKRPQTAREVIQALQAIAPPGRAAGLAPAVPTSSTVGTPHPVAVQPAGTSPAALPERPPVAQLLPSPQPSAAVAIPLRPAPASGGRKRRPWVLAVAAAGFLAAAVMATVVIIQFTDKNGQTQRMVVDLPPGATNPQIVPPTKDVDNPAPPPGPGVPPIPQGDPLSPLALVKRPARIDGVQSWTLETNGHRGRISSVAYSPDGGRVATGGEDGTVRLWDVATKQLLRIFVNPEGQVMFLAWSPDGKTIAAQVADKTRKVICYDAASGQSTLMVDSDGLIGWSSDGKKLFTVAVGGAETQIWGYPDGGQKAHFPISIPSPDGKTLAGFSNYPGPIRLLDGGTRTQLKVLGDEDYSKGLLCLVWSPDGKSLAVERQRPDKQILDIWDTETGEKKAQVSPKDRFMGAYHLLSDASYASESAMFDHEWSVAWSHDGKQVTFLTGVRVGGCSVQTIEAATGKDVRTPTEIEVTRPCRRSWALGINKLDRFGPDDGPPEVGRKSCG